MNVELLVCPTVGCGNYYGARGCHSMLKQPSGVDLESRELHREQHGSPYKFARAECPDCRARTGERVVRQPITIAVDVPEERETPRVMPPSVGGVAR